MKRALLGCLCIIASVAFAQPDPIGAKVRFGVQGNVTSINMPGPEINGTQPLKDVYGSGYGGGIHLDVGLALFSFRLSGDYVTFAPDNDRYRNALAQLAGQAASQFTIEGGRINIISGAINGKMQFLPLPVVSPYLTGGVGLARISADETKITFAGQPSTAYSGFTSETKTAFNLGAGVDLNIGVALYLEAKYTWILTDGETSTYLPVTLGVTF